MKKIRKAAPGMTTEEMVRTYEIGFDKDRMCFEYFIEIICSILRMLKVNGNYGKPPKEKTCSRNIRKHLENMVRFILQEGLDRANEIDARTEEEFNISKGEDVQQGRLKLNEEYTLKEKKMKVIFKTKDSVFLNQSRLREVQAKEDIVNYLHQCVKDQVKEDLKNKERYRNILMLLTVEGLYKVMEPEVTVRCRARDLSMMEEIIPDCQQIYETSTKRQVKMTIDMDTHLSCESLGGIVLYLQHNKIVLTNTMDERIDQIFNFCMPAIYKCLFSTRTLLKR